MQTAFLKEHPIKILNNGILSASGNPSCCGTGIVNYLRGLKQQKKNQGASESAYYST